MVQNRMSRGVRRINEFNMQDGRTLIITEEQADKLLWADIPVGSIRINTKNGTWSVKLEGESDWVPGGIKNDGTINVIKDSRIATEKFILKKLDISKTEFEYYYNVKDEEHIRHGLILYKNENGGYGTYNEYGEYHTWQECKNSLLLEDDNLESKYKNVIKAGYVFELETGTYGLSRNHLEITIDNVLTRTVSMGGIQELTETKFCLTEDHLEDGMEIVATYICSFKLGNPYPRTFINTQEPEEKAAEYGDLWFNPEGSLMDDDTLSKNIEEDDMISWDRIRPSTRPTTLAGYGIKDKLSYQGHTHTKKDITDFPTSMKANGGRADSAAKADKAESATRAESAYRATMAAEATKAFNDELGRNIVETYASKAELEALMNRLDEMIVNAVPVGTIQIYSSNNELPYGYLLCDGTAVSREKYPKLFEVIGTIYGQGDGKTTFNLPNLISKFPEGGKLSGVYKEAGLPNITSTWSSTHSTGYHNQGISCSGAIRTTGRAIGQGTKGGGDYSAEWNFNASRCSPIYGRSNTVQPSSLVIKYMIKCK